MTNQLAVIHIAKKQLDLDDDDYRAVLHSVTGKTSSRDMSDGERGRVIEEFKRLGFSSQASLKHGSPSLKHGSKRAYKRLEGDYAPKLQALWISGWNLGFIRDNSDAAMLAFVKRQTKIDHTRFLRYADDASRAIESLKKWLERDGGVDWAKSDIPPSWTQSDGARIALAQIRKGYALGLFQLYRPYRAIYEGIVRKSVDVFTARDWITVHQNLGSRIRAAIKKKSAKTEGGE